MSNFLRAIAKVWIVSQYVRTGHGELRSKPIPFLVRNWSHISRADRKFAKKNIIKQMQLHVVHCKNALEKIAKCQYKRGSQPTNTKTIMGHRKLFLWSLNHTSKYRLKLCQQCPGEMDHLR